MPVSLGFVNDVGETPAELLTSAFFPSKVGGRPAWLAQPGPSRVECPSCHDVLSFAFQVYAPGDGADAFHRTLFFFVCTKESCLQKAVGGGVRVLRSQLARANDFYSAEPPDYDGVADASAPEDADKAASARVTTEGDTPCPWLECEMVIEEEEPVETDNGGDASTRDRALSDESEDGEEDGDGDGDADAPVADITDDDVGEVDDEKVQAMLDEYRERVAKDGPAVTNQMELKDLEEAMADAQGDRRDVHFAEFTRATRSDPDQVVRYGRTVDGWRPIWVTDKGRLQLSEDDASAAGTVVRHEVSPCPRCGEARKVEMQVLPQMLHFMRPAAGASGLDDVDWATIVLFSCPADCDVDGAYVDEWVFIQPMT